MLEHKISLDIRPIVSKIHQEWDGEESGSFPRFLQKNKNKQRVMQSIDRHIPEGKVIYDLDMKDRNAYVHIDMDPEPVLDSLVSDGLFGHKIY